MSISSKFSVAIHILSLIELDETKRASSDYIAKSVQTNPVVIRKIMGLLKKAGLLETQAGVAGATLAKPIDDITLLDVYSAVDVVKENGLFSIHDGTNLDCIVGRNIQQTVEPIFIAAQFAMEKVLANVSMKDVLDKIQLDEQQKA